MDIYARVRIDNLDQDWCQMHNPYCYNDWINQELGGLMAIGEKNLFKMSGKHLLCQACSLSFLTNQTAFILGNGKQSTEYGNVLQVSFFFCHRVHRYVIIWKLKMKFPLIDTVINTFLYFEALTQRSEKPSYF